MSCRLATWKHFAIQNRTFVKTVRNALCSTAATTNRRPSFLSFYFFSSPRGCFPRSLVCCVSLFPVLIRQSTAWLTAKATQHIAYRSGCFGDLDQQSLMQHPEATSVKLLENSWILCCAAFNTLTEHSAFSEKHVPFVRNSLSCLWRVEGGGR